VPNDDAAQQLPEPGDAETRPDEPLAADDAGLHRLHPLAERAATPEGETRGHAPWSNLHRMMDVPLSLTVELGSTELPLAEVLRLDSGSVVSLDRLPGEPIDLLINGQLFARGEVVVINDTFGYRITELVNEDDVVPAMGADG
jgi:flagellar motor switch protein FliN/FliY